jgi:hypothetical protein
MKTTLRNSALLVAFFFVGNIAQASFPYKENAKEQKKTENVTTVSKNEVVNKEISNTDLKAETSKVEASNGFFKKALEEKWIALLLWFFLGGLAAHRWYKKKPAINNILYIITLGGCGIWAIIDLINILTDNF